MESDQHKKEQKESKDNGFSHDKDEDLFEYSDEDEGEEEEIEARQKDSNLIDLDSFEFKELTEEQRTKLIAKNLVFEHEWIIYYDTSVRKVSMTPEDWKNNIKKLGSFTNVESFWRYWNVLGDTTKFPDGMNLRFFKSGISPMWEDPSNENGGKWVIHSEKQMTSKYWNNLILAMIGEQFEHGDGLCGVMLSIRPNADVINLWNSSGEAKEGIEVTKSQLSTILGCGEVKYQLHKAAVQLNQVNLERRSYSSSRLYPSPQLSHNNSRRSYEVLPPGNGEKSPRYSDEPKREDVKRMFERTANSLKPKQSHSEDPIEMFSHRRKSSTDRISAENGISHKRNNSIDKGVAAGSPRSQHKKSSSTSLDSPNGSPNIKGNGSHKRASSTGTHDHPPSAHKKGQLSVEQIHVAGSNHRKTGSQELGSPQLPPQYPKGGKVAGGEEGNSRRRNSSKGSNKKNEVGVGGGVDNGTNEPTTVPAKSGRRRHSRTKSNSTNSDEEEVAVEGDTSMILSEYSYIAVVLLMILALIYFWHSL